MTKKTTYFRYAIGTSPYDAELQDNAQRIMEDRNIDAEFARSLTILWGFAVESYRNQLIGSEKYQVSLADIGVVFTKHPRISPAFACLPKVYDIRASTENSEIWAEFIRQFELNGF